MATAMVSERITGDHYSSDENDADGVTNKLDSNNDANDGGWNGLLVLPETFSLCYVKIVARVVRNV